MNLSLLPTPDHSDDDHNGPAPIALSELTRRIAALWASEPAAGGSMRLELLRELHDLDETVDRLIMHRNAGRAIAAHHVRSCCRRYLYLREQWPDAELAA